MTAPRKPPQVREKDPYWWMHPAFKGRQALALEDLAGSATDAYRWVASVEHDGRDERANAGLPIGQGRFKEFAQLLFKMNDYKPGPVKNWYVVVCVEAGKRWAVGQLRADPTTPVQLFENLVFDNESQARDAAASLKSAR